MPYNEVYVWGDNLFGQLGLGNIQLPRVGSKAAAQGSPSKQLRGSDSQQLEGTEQSSLSVLPQAALPKICCFNTVVSKVSCGVSHTMMLSSSGHVYCMGSNQYG